MDNNTDTVNKTYNSKIHFWGRVTVGIAFILSMMIPLYLTFILGHEPNFEGVFKAVLFIIGIVGVLYIIEPISYFPILGASGSYMSFLSGNVANMRMPAVGAVQNALNLEPGTIKSEVAAVFAIVSSIIVNLIILIIVIIAGKALIEILPAGVVSSFSYAIPGIFGAMTVTFMMRLKLKEIVSLVAIGTAYIVVGIILANVISARASLIDTLVLPFAAVTAIILAYIQGKK
jgi:hypothetical protein